MITEVSPEAHKILKRWAKEQAYVYIRPISSLFLDPKKKHKLYWNVSVEHRGMDWNKWGGEGYDLSAVIVELGLRVPRFSTASLSYHPKDFVAGPMPVMKMASTGKKQKSKKPEKVSSGRIRKNR